MCNYGEQRRLVTFWTRMRVRRRSESPETTPNGEKQASVKIISTNKNELVELLALTKMPDDPSKDALAHHEIF